MAARSEQQSVAAARAFALPLVIAVTGHRDLVATEVGGIRERVCRLFCDLRERYPTRELRIMSPLAEGADRLVAQVAIENGAKLVAPLPMQRDLYVADFESEESLVEFDALCEAATE